MKNSELLTTKRQDLDHIEKQRRYILRCLVQNNACPNCGHMLNFFEGAGIAVDEWQDKAGGTPCQCAVCHRELRYVVPFLVLGGNGGWHWHLVPICPMAPYLLRPSCRSPTFSRTSTHRAWCCETTG